MRVASLVLVVLAASCAMPSDDADVTTSSSELVVSAIPRRSTWKYWDRGGDLGTTWRGTTFDDSTWSSGAGPLGYGESYISTTVSFGSSSSNKHITTYFRRRFQVGDPATLVAMRGEIMFDDGVVVYLNGVRIGSDSMPAGTTTASTRALGHEANNAYNVYDWTTHIDLLVAGTNTIAFEVHQVEPSSSDLVFDASLEVTTEELDHNIPVRSTWKYWDRGGELGTAWRLSSFDDSAWGQGAAILGYGESYLSTVVGYGPDANNKHVTTYFRKNFLVDDPAGISDIRTSLLYDDGIALFVNGNLMGTRNMPSVFTPSTLASTGHEAGVFENLIWADAGRFLVSGTNTIAVEVHQVDRSSSDLVFDMSLTMDNQPPPPPDSIPPRSEWLYWDKGGDLGTAWRQLGYFTGDWRSGRGVLGYGESYVTTTVSFGPSSSSKFITTYFRKTFRVDDPAIITGIRGDLMYDDGAVVYLNGVEIQRNAMPAGTITAATRSSGHELDNAYETFDWTFAKQHLRVGDNVIAVEIHQQSGSSSDLTFDLALRLDTSTTCPVTDLPRRAFHNGSTLKDVWVGTGGVVWTSGDNGMVGRRADADGGAWCWVTPAGPDASIQAIWGTDESNLWLVGQAGPPNHEALVMRFDGERFITHQFGPIGQMQDVWGLGPNDMWVVGGEGIIRHWNGTLWEVLDLPPAHHLYGVWGASSTQVWLAGANTAANGDTGIAATIYKLLPATRNWTIEAQWHEPDPNGNFFYGIKGSSASDIWAVGRSVNPAEGIVARYDGVHWTMFPPAELPPGSDGYFDVAPRSPGAANGAWLAGRVSSMVRYDSGTWSTGFPDSFWLLSVDARGPSMWAVGYAGKINYWNGTDWVIHRPAMP